VDAGVALAVALALLFAFTIGVQDSANSIATLIATRAGRPGPALLMATAGMLVGPFVLGSAVADTIAGIVDIEPGETNEVVIAALGAALVWNLVAWQQGLPSSSSHALVGGLVGSAVGAAGLDAVNWGGLDGWRPSGVLVVLIVLAISPIVGVVACLAVLALLRRGLRRGTRRFEGPVRDGQWVASAVLSLGQGANDAQKAIGVIAAVLLADGTTSSLDAPLWATAGAAIAMAAGAALGGWKIVRTIGRRIYDLRPLDALSSQAGSAAVIVAASVTGAPVSATHVVSSSVVGAGIGRRRWSRIRWSVVTAMGIAWVTTMPATALIAFALISGWRWLS
jgi:inorganic phosphate transporter, PiT family